MLPVMNSMLSETAGLGFIGVVISIMAVKEEHSWLGSLSAYLFGEAEALIEEFEFIHNTFFWVAISYFTTNACILLFLFHKINLWERAYRLEPLLAMLEGEAFVKEAVDRASRRSVRDSCREDYRSTARDAARDAAGEGSSTASSTFGDRRDLDSVLEHLSEERVLQELSDHKEMRSVSGVRSSMLNSDKMKQPVLCKHAHKKAAQALKANKHLSGPNEIECEYLRFRHRFIDQARYLGVPIPHNFKFRLYLQETAAEQLKELTELDPVMISIFWVPMGAAAIAINLIFMTQYDSLDASGGVMLESSPRIMLLLPLLFPLWSYYNYRANLSIKEMLMPQPFAKGDTSAEHHAPQYLEGLPEPEDNPDGYPHPHKGRHEKLFSIMSFQVGNEVYLELQKLNLFCMVLTIIMSFKYLCNNAMLLMEGSEGELGQEGAHGRVLQTHATAQNVEEGTGGPPPGTIPELVYGLLIIVVNFCGLSLTPKTFIQYNYATATEGYIDMERLSEVLRLQNKERLASTLASLLLFCERLGKIAVPHGRQVTIVHENLLHGRVAQEMSVSEDSKVEFAELRANNCTAAGKICMTRRTAEEVEEDWAALLENANPDCLIDLRHFVATQALSNDITKLDVQKIASELGYTLKGASLDSFFKYMDTNNSGTVDFQEFATALLLKPRKADDAVNYRTKRDAITGRLASDASHAVKTQLYWLFDVDDSRTIDEEEFVERLAAWGCDTLGIEMLFDDIAGHSQTTICYTQFFKFLNERTKMVGHKFGDQKLV